MSSGFKQMLLANVGAIYSWSGNKMVAPEVNGRTVPEHEVAELQACDWSLPRKQAKRKELKLWNI